MLGAGLVDPGQFIEPYHPEGSSNSPHNSYLTMAIRAGIIGGIAYLVVIMASLVHGALFDRDEIEAVAVLTLAVGFAAHQQFEAYTLFNWDSSAVLAVLGFGFLIFGAKESSFSTQDEVFVYPAR